MEEVLFHPRYSEILADFKKLNQASDTLRGSKGYKAHIEAEYAKIQKKYNLPSRKVKYKELEDSRLVVGEGNDL